MRPQSDKQAAKTREGCFLLYLAVIHTEWYASNYAKRMINENVAFANDLFTQYNDFYIGAKLVRIRLAASVVAAVSAPPALR